MPFTLMIIIIILLSLLIHTTPKIVTVTIPLAVPPTVDIVTETVICIGSDTTTTQILVKC